MDPGFKDQEERVRAGREHYFSESWLNHQRPRVTPLFETLEVILVEPTNWSLIRY